jgi:polysaccharide export outer membrane protein
MILLFDQDPKYSGDVTVRPDGKITLPLVHEIQAAGLTPRELKEALTKAYAKYFPDPALWVVVKEINSLRVSIIGEVITPGEYRFTDSMNVLQLIAIAGGFSAAATRESIAIIRKTPLPDGRPNRIFINYKKLLGGFPTNEVLQLEPGDQVAIK